jgi:hypothetical protein
MNISFPVQKAFAQTVLPPIGGTNNDLAQKLRDGTVALSDIPAFIGYFIEFLIAVAGIVAFIAILVGAYQYIIGGVYTEMKEKGKTTLTYAIAGFVLALVAYGIVNFVQLAVTS